MKTTADDSFGTRQSGGRNQSASECISGRSDHDPVDPPSVTIPSTILLKDVVASAALENVDAAKTINGLKIMIDSAVNSPASSYLPRFEIRVGTQAQGSYDSFKDAMIVAMKLSAIYPAAAITVIDLTSGAAVFDTDGAVLPTSWDERTNHNDNADIGAHTGELTPLTQWLLNQAQMNGT